VRAKGDDRRPAWTVANSCVAIRGFGVALKAAAPVPAQPAGSSAKGGGLARQRECMKTILNTDRLNRLPARFPPRRAGDFRPPTAPLGDVGIAQPAASVPRNSARRPAPSERAVRRPIWRLHTKERARYVNPLISASPLFSPRGEAKYVRGASVGGERLDVARASWRAAPASGPASPRHSPLSTAGKRNEAMAGLSRASPRHPMSNVA